MITTTSLTPSAKPPGLPDEIWQLVTAGELTQKTEVFTLLSGWFMVRNAYRPERFFVREEGLLLLLPTFPQSYVPYVPRPSAPSDFDVDAFLSGLDL